MAEGLSNAYLTVFPLEIDCYDGNHLGLWIPYAGLCEVCVLCSKLCQISYVSMTVRYVRAEIPPPLP